MLNNQWLHTFKTLVEVGHFTKAAEKLFMTQPGVSQHIKKLEQSLSTPLIIKVGKRFELTEQGSKVYLYACESAKQEESLREMITLNSPYQGECRFAMSGALCMQFQSTFIARQKKYRQLAISLEAAPNSRIASDLINNKIDIGLMSKQLPSEQLNYQIIGKEKLCLALPKSAHSMNISKDNLIALGYIDHPDCSHYLAQLLGSLEMEKVKSDIPINGYINQLSQILYPVAEGLGFTVLPSSAIHAFPEQNKIHIAELPTQINETVYLVSKQNRPIAKRYQWFIDSMKRSF